VVSANVVDQETLDVRSTCRILGVSQATLRRAIARGEFPTVKVPGIERVLVSRRELERILHGSETPEGNERPRLSAA
jgi:excisionase family DNA binding protein